MTSTSPKVSVVIPAYNAAPFIRDALDSVLAQSFKDFEVLVVDDGSTDATRGIVAEYGPGVRCLRQENAGPAAARNRGIALSRGEFIAFLDSDDIWLPTKLERQLELFSADPSLGLVTTGHRGFTAEGLMPPERDKRRQLFRGGNVARSIFLHSNVATPTVMVPRRVLDRVGIFEEDLQIGEDDNLWIRIASVFPVGLVDEVLVHCRVRPSSLTTDGDRFFSNVERNLLRLQERYPEVKEKIEGAMPRKLSAFYLAWGSYLLRNDALADARRKLSRAILNRPGNGKAWGYFLISAMPLPLVQGLRRLKRHRDRRRPKANA